MWCGDKTTGWVTIARTISSIKSAWPFVSQYPNLWNRHRNACPTYFLGAMGKNGSEEAPYSPNLSRLHESSIEINLARKWEGRFSTTMSLWFMLSSRKTWEQFRTTQDKKSPKRFQTSHAFNQEPWEDKSQWINEKARPPTPAKYRTLSRLSNRAEGS